MGHVVIAWYVQDVDVEGFCKSIARQFSGYVGGTRELCAKVADCAQDTESGQTSVKAVE